MSPKYTAPDTASLLRRVAFAGLALLLGLASLQAQPRSWRQIGNTLQLLGLPSPAGGSIERVWYSADGDRLMAFTSTGEVWATENLESWTRRPALLPPPSSSDAIRVPEPSALVRGRTRRSAVLYAGGTHVWRSENAGSEWENMTSLNGVSILGSRIKDLAVHPLDDSRLVAATSTGIWLSLDGGTTWSGLNEGLPNFRIRRLTAAAEGVRGVRVLAESAGEWTELEWMPGQRSGWIPASGGASTAESNLRVEIVARLAALAVRNEGLNPDETVGAVAASGDARYAALTSGRIAVSLDLGATWRFFNPEAGSVSQIWIDPSDARGALAVSGGDSGDGARVLRTLNGGVYWDDITANLPAGEVRGIAADRSSGAVYIAMDRGVFWTMIDLRAPSPAANWTALAGDLPAGAVTSVALDKSATEILAAVDGYGVFATAAPHLSRRPVLVQAADYTVPQASPGALLAMLGAGASRVTAGGREAVVLAASLGESQIQLPFDLSGDSVDVSIAGGGPPLAFPLRLKPSSPSVLTDREGTPFIIDASTGVAVDAMYPLRGGMRIEILATGLGRVTPDWPAGLPAPADNPPKVAAEVRVLVDGVPAEIVSARLAPGYVGFYLIEAKLPAMLDSGPAELRVLAGGNSSSPVRVYIDR